MTHLHFYKPYFARITIILCCAKVVVIQLIYTDRSCKQGIWRIDEILDRRQRKKVVMMVTPVNTRDSQMNKEVYLASIWDMIQNNSSIIVLYVRTR